MIMTKKEQIEYLQKYVASQGTQVGLSITPLLESIINGSDAIFVVTVEDNVENTKKVTNAQQEINDFIVSANADPLHNTPKIYIDGVVLSFTQVEIAEDEINGIIFVDGGKYLLTLSTTEESSQLVYSPNEP